MTTVTIEQLEAHGQELDRLAREAGGEWLQKLREVQDLAAQDAAWDTIRVAQNEQHELWLVWEKRRANRDAVAMTISKFKGG